MDCTKDTQMASEYLKKMFNVIIFMHSRTTMMSLHIYQYV